MYFYEEARSGGERIHRSTYVCEPKIQETARDLDKTKLYSAEKTTPSCVLAFSDLLLGCDSEGCVSNQHVTLYLD